MHFQSVINILRISIFLYFWFSVVEGGNHERRLFNKFKEELQGFAKYERPAKEDNEPLVVEMGLTLQQIIDVDEINQIIYTNMWITMAWQDYKLSWDPQEFSNITQVTLPNGLIWKPDILMYNSAADAFDASYQSAFRVNATGHVEQIPPGMFKSSCSINIKYFPFDDQICKMKFGSWTYDGTKIDLRLLAGKPAGSLDGFTENGEWHLLGPGVSGPGVSGPGVSGPGVSGPGVSGPGVSGPGVSGPDFPAERNVIYYDCCPDNPFYDLTFSIHLRRRKLYYVVNIVAPCMLFAFLGLFTFTLPPDAGEKISFGITVLLSLTVFMMIVSETLPQTSEAIPLIGIYFMGIMGVTAGSIVSTILCLNFHHRNADTHTMPRWMKVGIGEWLAWILRMKRPGYEPVDKRKRSIFKAQKERSDLKMLNVNASESLMANVRGADDAPEYFYSGFAVSSPNIQHIDASHTNQALKLDSMNLSTSSAGNMNSTSMARFELRAILRELKYLTEQHREGAKDDQTSSDWKWCAMVLDRLFIWLFLIINTVVTVIVMLYAPNLFN